MAIITATSLRVLRPPGLREGRSGCVCPAVSVAQSAHALPVRPWSPRLAYESGSNPRAAFTQYSFDGLELIRGFAAKLAASGCTALMPNYFEATNTPASTNIDGDAAVMGAVQPNRDQWVATLGDCLAFAAGRSDVRADRLGLLGFSLGHLTLRAAKRKGGQSFARPCRSSRQSSRCP
jgi:hypothetical protein